MAYDIGYSAIISAVSNCNRIIFGVYKCWRALNFLLFSEDLILLFNLNQYKCTFSNALDLAEDIKYQRL